VNSGEPWAALSGVGIAARISLLSHMIRETSITSCIRKSSIADMGKQAVVDESVLSHSVRSQGIVPFLLRYYRQRIPRQEVLLGLDIVWVPFIADADPE
jgi:hypothetical protein